MNITTLYKVLLTVVLLVSAEPSLFAQSATDDNGSQRQAFSVVTNKGGGNKNGGAMGDNNKHEEVIVDLENRTIKPVFGNSVSGGDQEGSDGFGDNGDDDITAGDANGDGKVTLADAAAIISYLNNHSLRNFDSKAADADENGTVDRNDIEKVIMMLLGK